MRRLLPLVALALVAITGCKKKGEIQSSADDVQSDGGTFVEIDLGGEEELDDLMGSELIQATAQCGDLRSLEPSAMMGKLNDGQIRCLDDALRASDKQTHKDKLSRVLMADAWAKGDLHRWEGIVRRHLNEIDRSDADLCYSFAKHLASQGPEKSDETLKWAEMALENRTQWTGDVHINRVNALYKIRAVASQRKWTWFEEKYVAEPTEQMASERDKARNEAKTLAREWLDYAKSSGKDYTMAMQLCLSAAGTAGFCDLDED